MNILRINVDKKERLDKIVYTFLINEGFILSRNRLLQILPSILLDNQKYKAGSRVQAGSLILVDLDRVKLELEKIKEQKELESNIVEEEGNLNIIDETEDYLVVYKPAGVIVHPGSGVYTGTLANWIKSYFIKQGVDVNSLDRVGIVHRLDKGTSGILIIAKNISMQRWLIKQFENHRIMKLYKMTVNSIPNKYTAFKCSKTSLLSDSDDLNNWCNPDKTWYLIDGIIMRDPKNRKRMFLNTVGGYAGTRGYAKTFFKFCNDNIVFARICTGRTHQIRASLKKIGITIVGDSLYKSASGCNPEHLELSAVFIKFKNLDKKWVEYSLI